MRESGSKERTFWESAGNDVPAFFSAPSTLYYRACEQDLFRAYFQEFRGARILKTDLWDEAKNTRILIWAAGSGADVFAVDLASSIVEEARRQFAADRCRGRFAAADLRSLPFADHSFDFIYSMGTIEHFLEVRAAVGECFRVLKRGGRAIIGVPNLFDPFFRPLMVGILRALRAYVYGYEKAFSFGALERLLRSEGFRIVDRSGLLFLPGWLRMLDIYLATRSPRAVPWTRPFVSLFSRWHRRYPGLGRHGYLIASVVEKP
jgi:SAM-dependent methyltransferase